MIKNIRYTLLEGNRDNMSAVELSRWVREKMSDYSSRDSLMVARELIRGGGWEPPYYLVNQPEGEGQCFFEVTKEYDEYEQADQEQDRLWALQRLGAEGNEQAAIAFCQAIRDGRFRWPGARG